MSRMRSLALAVALCSLTPSHSAGALTEAPLMLTVPLGLSPLVPVPPDNPLTAAKAALGRRLFFDKRLSRDGRVACASCHKPEHGFADDRPLSTGVAGRIGRRNVPSLLNRVYAPALFWDGRAASLEEQALAPMIGSTEMANTHAAVVTRVAADLHYVDAFRDAFGSATITIPRIADALASFERTLLSGDAPADRYERLGNEAALTRGAARGRALFRGKARCHVCHDGPLFTDQRFHNTGVSWDRLPLDRGRYEVTRRDADLGAFRTPSLREVQRTAPYMHDGSIATLADVVAFYDRGAGRNPYTDDLLVPLRLTGREQRDLVAFLEALTSGQ